MAKRPKEKLEQFALTITRAIGSVESIIIHTIFFAVSFVAVLTELISFERMLLILTTIVSLEAIYLAIFIQMTVNFQGRSLEEVEQDIEEIQEDIDEIQEDVDEIQEDVDEIQEDVDEIQEDVEEMTEDEKEEERREAGQARTLEEIHGGLQKLMKDIEQLQGKK